ncbi:MAG: bacteriohemerythrin [Krumholzibacteria bacterium]|nr:bacteriohemerythrin [Candidatus Krumholzibacteria bacterium]
MPAIAWSNEFSVGVEALDTQHRRLFDVVNELDEAIEKLRGQRVTTGVLRELVGYTQEHFAFEEQLMAEAGYPDLPAHQAQHRAIIQKIERFEYELNGEGYRISREVRDFLQQWLMTHIARDDMAFAGALAPGKVKA